MALATLSIDLVAQLASLQQGMDKAGRLAEKQAQQIENSFKGIKVAALGVGSVLAAAFPVTLIAGFIRATVDGLDRLNDLSDATGASIENLSALEDIAARTGTSMDTVGDAVLKLNKVLAEAKPGTAAAESLKALGLNAEALKRLDPAEALRQVSVALAGFADNGDKARLVQELFGKSVQQVAGLLKDLAEAGRLNGTVTTEQVKAAEEFNKQLARLSKDATDAARNIAGPLVTSLNDFFSAMRRFSSNEGGFFSGVGEQLNVDFLRARLQATKEEIERLAPDAERARGILAVQPDSIRARATLAEFADLNKAADDYRKSIDAIVFAGAKRRPANEGGGKVNLPGLAAITGEKATGKPQEVVAFVVKLDDATAAALKRLEGSDAQKIAALRLELQALIELRAGSGGGAVDEAILEVEEALAALDPAIRAAAESKRRLDAILAQTPSAQLDAVLVDVELLNRAFEAGQIKVERWAEGVRVATARLPDAVQEPLAKIDEFTRQSAANIQDALGDSLLATFEGNTGSIEEIWKNMLRRLVAQAAAAQIGKALLGDSYGSTGQVGGGIGALFDLFKGFGGARANGGPVMAGRPYLVGEMGPEIVVPRTAGTVLPNGVGMSGGAQIDNRIIVQGDASARTLRLIRAGQNMQAARLANEGRY